MRIKILSDRDCRKAQVVNAATGEALDGVTAVRLDWAVNDAVRVTLELIDAEVEVTGTLNRGARNG